MALSNNNCLAGSFELWEMHQKMHLRSFFYLWTRFLNRKFWFYLCERVSFHCFENMQLKFFAAVNSSLIWNRVSRCHRLQGFIAHNSSLPVFFVFYWYKCRWCKIVSRISGRDLGCCASFTLTHFARLTELLITEVSKIMCCQREYPGEQCFEVLWSSKCVCRSGFGFKLRLNPEFCSLHGSLLSVLTTWVTERKFRF